MYSRVEKHDDPQFFLDVHQQGRKIEHMQVNGEVSLVQNCDGSYLREQLTPDRNRKSVFASVLDILCNKDPTQRTSAEHIIQSEELKSCLKCIREQAVAANGNIYILFFIL
jgi:hypothetical protein